MSGPQTQDHIRRFGPYEADLRTRELRKNGYKLKVHGTPFEVLAALLERPGDLVTREELFKRLWPDGTFVDFDNNLNSAVKRLRDALGDNAEQPKYIETLPRLGYRFLAPGEAVVAAEAGGPLGVSPPAAAGSSPSIPIEHSLPPRGAASHRSFAPRTAAAVLLAAVALGGFAWWKLGTSGPQRTIAVLPFENLSAEADQEYLSDALTEEMITQLARQAPANLGVIARTTAMKYKGSKQSVRDIGRELAVDYIVEGSVRRVGGQLRVTAQLIETRNQSHLWAQSFDRQFAGLLELEKELGLVIARQVTAAVAPSIPSTRTAAAAGKSPANAEAYEAYLRARYYHGQASVRSVNQAVDFYRLAIEKDPNYALAHAGLARAYIFATRIRPRDALFQASASAQKAVALNPSLPEARLALAMTRLYNDRDFAAAEQEFQRAVEMDPGNAEVHFYYAHCLAAMGRAEDSIAAARRAQSLDPFSPLIGHYIGRLYHFARRYDQAIREYQKTIEMDPNYAWAHFFLALSYERQGKFEDGLRARQKYWSLVGVKPDEVNALGEAYKSGGRAAVLRRWTQWIEGFVERDGYVTSAELALNCAQLGEMDNAFRWLERAAADHTRDLVFVRFSPDFEPLRSDARFAEIERRVATPASAAPVGTPHTLAVLPLRNLNSGAEFAYLGNGMADEIAARLSFEPQWAVRFSGGWLRSYDPNPAPAQVARELHAQHILSGSFAIDKGRLTFVGELVRMPDGAPAWSGKLNAGLQDGLAAVPELVAEQIAAALHQVPRRLQVTRPDRPLSANAVSAYRLFLKGTDAARRGSNPAAMQWAERALSADPEFGPAMTLLAYSTIADAYEGKAAARPPALVRAMKLYRQALKRGAASPAHLSVSGLFLMELGRLDDSVELLRHAIRLNPNHGEAYLWLSQAYRYAGMLKESAEQAETALRLDPAVRELSTINTFLYLGEYDRFLQTLPQAHLNSRTFFYRGLAYYAKRDFPRAEAEFTRAIELEPNLLHARYGLALRCAIRSEKGQGLALARQLEVAGHPDGEMRYKLAQVYAALGDRPAALRVLASAVDARFICAECFARDPLLEPLRAQKEYAAILDRARQEQQAFRKKFY